MLLQIVGVFLMTSCVLANEFIPYSNSVNEERALNDNSYTDAEGRVFFVFTNASTTGSFVTFNTTLLLFSAGILLWGVAGGLALYYLLTAPQLDYGHSGYDSGYDSSYRSRRGSVVLPPKLNFRFSSYSKTDFLALNHAQLICHHIMH